MKKALTLLALALLLFSCGDNSVNISGVEGRLYCDFGPITQWGGGCYSINDASECDTQYGTVSGSCANMQYCDFGPVTQWGGGCFEIDDANNCDLEWGELANFCNSVNISGVEDPSSSSSTPSTTPQTANAVVITLTYWHTKDTDIGGLDPRIHFRVTAFQNGKSVSDNNSNVLLDAQDIPATWTGSQRSSPVPFVNQADSLVIRAVVIEKDALSNDDISPDYYTYWKTIPPNGHFGSTTLDYGSGLSKVSFDYEFIRQ